MGIGYIGFIQCFSIKLCFIFMYWILPCLLPNNFLANFFVKVSPCPFFFRSHLLRLLLTLLVDSLGWAEWAWPVKHMSTRWCYQYFQGFPLRLFREKPIRGMILKGSNQDEVRGCVTRYGLDHLLFEENYKSSLRQQQTISFIRWR